MTADVETRTLLFSDIEGSTRLLAMLGDDAHAELLGTHRAIVREGEEALIEFTDGSSASGG